uniref:Cytoplasmic tRNA 2-thiolation protein 1 (Trinotate prediction) n=1 Tax=Myxobolus squamalis TaxID=59785 RepID=A0A6B2FXD2_MYXSQ
MKTCYKCCGSASLKRSKNGNFACKNCFILEFEQEINDLIISKKLFERGETIAIGVSGGKDSSVVSYVLNALNNRYNYGWNLVLVAIDEGIKGYRDDSLKAVVLTQKSLNIPLQILSYKVFVIFFKIMKLLTGQWMK